MRKETKRMTEEEIKRKPTEKEDECEKRRQRRMRQRFSSNSWYICFWAGYDAIKSNYQNPNVITSVVL
jgi:hypothetical protein